MKHRKTIVFVLIMVVCTHTYSQKNETDYSSRPKNNINIGLLGNASIYALNYERLFSSKPYTFFASEIGVGYNEEFIICFGSGSCNPDKYLTIPHQISVSIGKNKSFLEFGFGGAAIIGSTKQYYLLYPMLGYRYQPLKSKKLNFRIYGSIPFSEWDTVDILYIPIGISLGICF